MLGLLLFSIYTIGVYHVADPAHSQMFADDILLDAASTCAHELSLTLSKSVSSLHAFLCDKGLILNSDRLWIYDRMDEGGGREGVDA